MVGVAATSSSVTLVTFGPNTYTNGGDGKGCEEKHSNTTAHHPMVTPPAAASTAV